MVIYGVALLAFCTLCGVLLGNILGVLLGVKANVGGVGIAMVMLIILSNLSSHKFHLGSLTKSGIGFWSAMYIPIVVAIVAGAVAVMLSFALIPVFARFAPDATDSIIKEDHPA